MERPKLAPILERAIAAGIMSEQQARDVDAFADGLVARVDAGELMPEEGAALCLETATRNALAERRARIRRGAPALSAALVLGMVLSAEAAAPEPATALPEPDFKLRPGANVEGLRQTVPFDPLWARRNEDVAGATVRQVRLAALRANERGFTAASLQARSNWNEPTLAGALIRTAVKWGLIP